MSRYQLSPLARALADRMSDLSEEHYCAGWLSGCEFDLWAMVLGGDCGWGFGRVEESDVEALRTLSEACGGWIRWNDEVGEEFVPRAEWDVIFAAEQARRSP